MTHLNRNKNNVLKGLLAAFTLTLLYGCTSDDLTVHSALRIPFELVETDGLAKARIIEFKNNDLKGNMADRENFVAEQLKDRDCFFGLHSYQGEKSKRYFTDELSISCGDKEENVSGTTADLDGKIGMPEMSSGMKGYVLITKSFRI